MLDGNIGWGEVPVGALDTMFEGRRAQPRGGHGPCRLFHVAVCDLKHVIRKSIAGKLEPELFPVYGFSSLAAESKSCAARSFGIST